MFSNIFSKKIAIFISEDKDEMTKLCDYLAESYLHSEGVKFKIEQIASDKLKFYLLKSKEEWYSNIVTAAFIYINEHREEFKNLYLSSKDQGRMQSIETIPINVIPEDGNLAREIQ